jgi:CBS domain-containing protein
MRRVSEAMTKEVRVASPEQPISEVARIMAEIDVGVLPVGENDRLVGMITDRDIAVRAVARDKPCTTKVREVMSSEVLYCYDDQDLEDVAQNMSDTQVRRMPVVNRDKRLVGILSLGDLAQTEKASTSGQTVADVSRRGGKHSQTPPAASSSKAR